MAAKEVADRVEGRSREPVEVAVEGPPIEFNIEVHFVDSDGNGSVKKLSELTGFVDNSE